MKAGKSLMELAAELDRQANAKKDLIGSTALCKVRPVLDEEREEMNAPLAMKIGDEPDAPVNQHALRQIGERLKIPAKFADRLAETHPDILAYNLNELFHREPEKRLIRLLDGRVRAFLSDTFRVVDNYDIAKVVLGGIAEHGAEVVSCDVTEKKMYIKAIIPGLKAEIPPPPGVVMGKGHNMWISTIQGGLSIGNSEVGCGKIFINPSIFTKECSNLATWEDYAYKKVHLGRRIESSADTFREFITDETRHAADMLLFREIKDITTASMDGRIFHKIKEELVMARTKVIERPVEEFVEASAKRFNLLETEATGIMEHLIRGGDLTKFGFHNAVTRHSADVDSYDRATELENLGGEIIELSPRDWKVLAEAA
jgi:hypothetical protein